MIVHRTDRQEPEPEEPFVPYQKGSGLGAARARHEACVDQLRSIVEYVRELEVDNEALRCSKEELRTSGEQLKMKNMRLLSQLRLIKLENGLTQPVRAG